MFHRWTVFEDIVVCAYAMERKTDPKSIKRLSRALGIKESKVAYRMSNFSKLVMGNSVDWHFSRQERKVCDWMLKYSTTILLKIVPTK